MSSGEAWMGSPAHPCLQSGMSPDRWESIDSVVLNIRMPSRTAFSMNNKNAGLLEELRVNNSRKIQKGACAI